MRGSNDAGVGPYCVTRLRGGLGTWNAGCGAWDVGCGVQHVECGMWYVGMGIPGFQVRGGGVNRAPQIWGGGGWEEGSIDRHH